LKANSVGVKTVQSIIYFPAVFGCVCFLSREKAACYVVWEDMSGLSVDNCHLVGT